MLLVGFMTNVNAQTQIQADTSSLTFTCNFEGGTEAVFLATTSDGGELRVFPNGYDSSSGTSNPGGCFDLNVSSPAPMIFGDTCQDSGLGCARIDWYSVDRLTRVSAGGKLTLTPILSPNNTLQYVMQVNDAPYCWVITNEVNGVGDSHHCVQPSNLSMFYVQLFRYWTHSSKTANKGGSFTVNY
jgi:hypothetical protein